VIALTLPILSREDVTNHSQERRTELYWVGVGASLTMLGVVTFFPLPITDNVPDYSQHPTLRYQFFAEIGHAVFWAALVYFVASFLQRGAWQTSTIALLSGVLCAGGVSESIDYQLKGGVLNPYFKYEISSATFLSIQKFLPELGAGDLIFLELSDGDNSPIGWNYTGLHFSCRFFGVPMNQGRINKDGTKQTRFWSSASTLHVPTPLCPVTHHFRVTQDGAVIFINTVRLPTAASNLDSCKAMCVLSACPGAPTATLPFMRMGLLKGL
jgi:hypothetical protein